MGFGLPAAIGCKVGAPEKIVIDIDGDASMSMTAMELATAAQCKIGVKCLVLNNGVQGMVYQWQGLSRYFAALLLLIIFVDLFYDSRYSHTEMANPDFVMLAKSMHVHGMRITNPAELPQKMKEFLEYDNSKPVLMECIVEPNEHVFPMVCFVIGIVVFCLFNFYFFLTGTGREGAASTNFAPKSQGGKLKSKCRYSFTRYTTYVCFCGHVPRDQTRLICDY